MVKMSKELQNIILEEVYRHLNETKTDDMSYSLRVKHIEMMIKLAEDNNLLDDTLLIAIIFHDVCKFEEGSHDKLSSEYLHKCGKLINLSRFKPNTEEAEIMISRHSDKENYAIYNDKIKVLMELDILSKYTEEYNDLYYLLIRNNCEEINFYQRRMNKLIKSIRKLNTTNLICQKIYNRLVDEMNTIMKNLFSDSMKQYDTKQSFINDVVIERLAIKLNKDKKELEDVFKEERLI